MEQRVTITSGSPNSSGLVLEQDFILQVRRLQKHEQKSSVVNVQLTQLPALAGKPDLIDAMHDRLHELVREAGGEMYQMTNRDVFFVVPEFRGDALSAAARIATAALPRGLEPGRSPIGWLEVYAMPDDYVQLRERINHYIEIAKAMEEAQADSPEALLNADEVRGPLTAYALSQIERLLDGLDIRKYLKTQTIRRLDKAGKWQVFYDEYYVSTRDMQQDKFPRLELRASGRLFGELASMLDRRTLGAMMRLQDQWQDSQVGLNLSAGTVLSSSFAQFCHLVHGPARARVYFELHVSEMLHEPEKFMNAIELLGREGFKVVVDGVTPRMLPFLRLENLPVGLIKLSVDRNTSRMLEEDRAVAQALAQLPVDRLAFMHIDSPTALELGQRLGVSLFQGFHVDEVVKSLEDGAGE